jgi:hypothetical protein
MWLIAVAGPSLFAITTIVTGDSPVSFMLSWAALIRMSASFGTIITHLYRCAMMFRNNLVPTLGGKYHSEAHNLFILLF